MTERDSSRLIVSLEDAEFPAGPEDLRSRPFNDAMQAALEVGQRSEIHVNLEAWDRVYAEQQAS